MSFQAYLTNIQAKTGKSPADFRALAEKKGFTQNGKLAPGVKAGAIVKWLKADFQLGHGHGHLRLAQGDRSQAPGRYTIGRDLGRNRVFDGRATRLKSSRRGPGGLA